MKRDIIIYNNYDFSLENTDKLQISSETFYHLMEWIIFHNDYKAIKIIFGKDSSIDAAEFIRKPNLGREEDRSHIFNIEKRTMLLTIKKYLPDEIVDKECKYAAEALTCEINVAENKIVNNQYYRDLCRVSENQAFCNSSYSFLTNNLANTVAAGATVTALLAPVSNTENHTNTSTTAYGTSNVNTSSILYFALLCSAFTISLYLLYYVCKCTERMKSKDVSLGEKPNRERLTKAINRTNKLTKSNNIRNRNYRPSFR